MERKEFLKTACALCGIAVASNILESCTKQSVGQPTVNFTVDLSNSTNAALKTTGSAMLMNQVYIINKDGINFIAVSSICTHNGCTVGFQSLAAGFLCPCHSATYTSAGVVTGGPAPANLKTFTVTKNGNILTITG